MAQKQPLHQEQPSDRVVSKRSRHSSWATVFGYRVKLSVKEWLKCVWKNVQTDDCVDVAAQMSFYFVLALLPFFVVLAGLASYVPLKGIWREAVLWITHYFPEDSQVLVTRIVGGLAASLQVFTTHLLSGRHTCRYRKRRQTLRLASLPD